MVEPQPIEGYLILDSMTDRGIQEIHHSLASVVMIVYLLISFFPDMAIRYFILRLYLKLAAANMKYDSGKSRIVSISLGQLFCPKCQPDNNKYHHCDAELICHTTNGKIQ
jgi:hypothetical protein